MSRLKSHLSHHSWPAPLHKSNNVWPPAAGRHLNCRVSLHKVMTTHWGYEMGLVFWKTHEMIHKKRKKCRCLINRFTNTMKGEGQRRLINSLLKGALHSQVFVFTKSLFFFVSAFAFWCSSRDGLLGLRLNSVSWEKKIKIQYVYACVHSRLW